MISAQASPRTIAWCKFVSRFANFMVVALGGLALLWSLTNWSFLEKFFPSIVLLRANAALAFVLSAVSVWFLQRERFAGAKILAVVVGFLGLATALEYILNRDLYVDHLFGNSPNTGRMAQVTAFEFFAVGFALFLSACKSRRAQWLGHFCLFVVGSIATLAVVAYIFGIETIQHLAAHSIGFYGGLNLMVLCCGILLARPDAGLMRILTLDQTSSAMALRLVAGTVLLPVILGWLCLEGFRAGYYGPVLGMALLAILSIFFFTTLVWLNLRLVQRKQLTESYLASIIESSDEAIVGVSCEGLITTWNRGAERLYGYSAAEMKGQTPALVVPPDRLEDIREIPEKLNRGERIEQYETIRLTKDGRRIEISLTASPIRDRRGNIIGFSGVARDISARKKAQQRDAAFSKLGQRLSSTTTDKDAVKIILEAADEIFGWDSASFDLYLAEQDSVFSVLAMDEVDGQRVEVAPGYTTRSPSQMARTVIKEGAQLILRDDKMLAERQMVRFGDASRPSASIMFVPVQNAGRIIGILSIQSYKINAYTKGDLQTLQSLAGHCAGALDRIHAEQRYRSIFDNAATGLFQLTPNFQFAVVNSPLARQLGYLSSHDLLAHVHDFGRDLFVEPDRFELFQRLLSETEMARGFHAFWRHKDGARLCVSLNAHAVKNEHGEIFYFEGSAEDITERKKSERELLLLAQALRSTNDCVCITDLEDKILFINESFLRTYGYEADELLGQSITLVRSERNDPSIVEQILSGAMQGGWQGELLNRRKNGEEFPISLSSGLIRDEEGRPVALIGVAEDITERKRAQEALASERNLLRTLLDNLPVCIFIKDTDGRFLLNNQTHLQFLGAKSPADVKGKSVADLFPHETADAMQASDHEVLQTGEPRTVDQTLRDAAGRERSFSTTKVPLRNADRKIIGLVCFSQDVTERLNLEAQLRHTQKMDSIGLLAGGIAHDFNNILTLIHGYAAILHNVEETHETFAEAAQQISIATERASNLTNQLLLFGRRQIMQPRNLDLNEVISGIVRMLRRILREDILLQVNYSPSLPLVRADRGMMEQIILNLSVNARDAMPQGGQINIVSSFKEFAPGDLPQNSDACAGNFVCLEISDSGCGIAPEILLRIFEPFFTTKSLGKGTGLGLATVYGIVKQHGGWIDFSSELGRGTTFRIYLPARADLVATPEKPVVPEPVRGGSETIFVVEDEAPVRQLVRGILERYGYQVIEASSGAVALGVWQERREDIHLLFSDMVLPNGISGRQLAERLKADKPELKIIFTSGYSFEQGGDDNLVLGNGTRFLQKPYEPWKLAQMVRETLDGY